MAKTIGIDLGTHAVKFAVFEGAFGRYELVDYSVLMVPQDLERPPTLDLQIEAMESLREAWDDNNGATVAAGFPVEKTSVHLIQLPFGDRAQIESTLPFEVENQVPFDLEEMLLTNRILHLEQGSSRALTALVSRSDLEHRLRVLAEAGTDPKHLILDADLLGSFADEGVQAVIDLGHTRSLITLCQDGKSLESRAISFGGRQLTTAIAQARGIDWENAEQRKHQVVLGEPTGTPVTADWEPESDEPTQPQHPVATAGPTDAEIVQEALQPFLQGLRITLLGFEDRHQVEIDEVLAVGGTSHMNGLLPLLSTDLGVPVSAVALPEEAQQHGNEARFALCNALGQAASFGAADSLDFRTEEFTFRGNMATLQMAAKVAAVLFLFLFVAGFGWFLVRHNTLSSDIANAENELQEAVLEAFPDTNPDRLTDASMALAIVQERTLETTSRVDALGAIVADDPPTLSLLREVSEGMPPHSEARIDVRELTISESSINIKAETDGFEAATRIETALQRNPKFSQARKGDEKKTGDSVRFSITIPLTQEMSEGEEG